MAVPYVLNLVSGDNPAKYRSHPVIVRGNQIQQRRAALMSDQPMNR